MNQLKMNKLASLIAKTEYVSFLKYYASLRNISISINFEYRAAYFINVFCSDTHN